MTNRKPKAKPKKPKAKPKKPPKPKKPKAKPKKPPKPKKPKKGAGVYSSIVKRLDPKADIRHGEYHVPQIHKGKLTFSEFCGPQTDVINRLKKHGTKTRTKTSKVCIAHDLAYTLSKDRKDSRKADKKMVEALTRLQKNKADHKWNTTTAKMGIQAKMKAEDWGLLKPERFTDYETHKGLSPEDLKLAEETLTQLRKEGYGKTTKTTKTETKTKTTKRKPTAWNKHVSKVRSKNPDKSFKECLQLASKSYKK